MAIVDSIMQMQSEMAAERYPWESVWRDVVNLCMPYASHKYEINGLSISSSLTGTYQQPQAAQRSKEVFDNTASWALTRLSAGMESLITPSAQKWHSYSLDDPFAPDPTDLEEEWLDALTDYSFKARYNHRTNFALANQKAIRGACGLGTGILYLEENLGRHDADPVKVPFFYQSVPVVECYLGINAYDEVDKCLRVYELTARAAKDYFNQDGDNLPEQVTAALEKKPDQLFTFIHAVMPRSEAGEYKDKRRHTPFASFWMEVSSRSLIRSSGFFTFPYKVMWWEQTDGSPYGQSPIMEALSEIKMLQVMGKTVAQVSQQMIKPPMATMRGIYNRLNLNSGAVNPGYLNEQGQLLAQPIIQAQNPTFAERLIETKRAGVRQSMFVDLFQILAEDPKKTATEALLRANEKGELLGPAGAKIETAIAQAVDREVDIIQRKGAFETGSPLEPPSTIDGRNIGVTFTGPLARMRRMAELQGMERVLQMATVVGQYDPSTLARIDGDQVLEQTREISGAPRKMFKTDDEVDQIRQAQAQQQEQAAAMQMAQGMAAAAKDATPAVQAYAQANGMAPA